MKHIITLRDFLLDTTNFQKIKKQKQLLDGMLCINYLAILYI